jgi:hypothetical protein
MGTGTRRAEARPATASIAVAGLLAGPARPATVAGSTTVAAYLELADGEHRMVALLAPGAVELPIGVAVAGPLPAAGSPAAVGDGLVAGEGWAWRPVRWWDPRPRVDAGRLRDAGSRLLEMVLQEPASAFGISPAMGFEVACALADGDAAPAVGVIGLGPGLTPAGDDVVAGGLAVLELAGRLRPAVWPAVEDRARSHTTTLSAALLAAAHRGQVVPPAGRLLAALAARCSEEGLLVAAGRLFAIGSTSGHDLALGMAGALAAIGSHVIEEAA